MTIPTVSQSVEMYLSISEVQELRIVDIKHNNCSINCLKISNKL